MVRWTGPCHVRELRGRVVRCASRPREGEIGLAFEIYEIYGRVEHKTHQEDTGNRSRPLRGQTEGHAIPHQDSALVHHAWTVPWEAPDGSDSLRMAMVIVSHPGRDDPRSRNDIRVLCQALGGSARKDLRARACW